MNWFDTIISQAEAEVANVEATATTVAPEIKAAIAGAKAAVANPAVQELIALFEQFTTHTATQGLAVVTEPKVT